MPHVPVLLDEVISLLNLQPGMFVIDGTVDGGGHSAEILESIGPSGKLLGLDWDETLLEECRGRLGSHPNVTLLHGNYADLPEILEREGLPKAHALLLDLGFSSEQLAESSKGFSFNVDEPLIMTYSSDRTPAHEVLRGMREKEIAQMLFDFGEERFGHKIAKAIVERQRKSPIRTTKDLADTVKDAVLPSYERGRIHPATRTFQALRIYVNDELGNVKRILENLDRVLQTGGRAAVISFHSLEDRIVKNAFRDMAHAKTLEVLTKKPIEATEEEARTNPRSRSAKLRVAELKDEY
jgi:16S rRNA (cytosine1402-N4)-methyltransferase